MSTQLLLLDRISVISSLAWIDFNEQYAQSKVIRMRWLYLLIRNIWNSCYEKLSLIQLNNSCRSVAADFLEFFFWIIYNTPAMFILQLILLSNALLWRDTLVPPLEYICYLAEICYTLDLVIVISLVVPSLAISVSTPACGRVIWSAPKLYQTLVSSSCSNSEHRDPYLFIYIFYFTLWHLLELSNHVV